MRIAFFTDTYLPQRDGVVSSIINFRRELEKEGHEVFIFAPGSRKDKKENRDAHVFYYSALPFQPYPDYKIVLFPYFSATRMKQLKIDLVHTHGIAGMGLAAYVAARGAKLPLVGSFHTFVTEALDYVGKSRVLHSVGKNVAWNYMKWYFGRCDAVTAPSKWAAASLEQKGIRNVQVLPPGIDVKRFRELDGKEFRKGYGLGKKPVVMYLGRVAREKNLEVLIKSSVFVLEEMPDAKFVIVGRGPAEKYYAALARQEGVGRAFVFTNFITDRELPDAYAACDVFAFPSTFETFGIVALEAMASGKPVACVKYGPLPELIKEGKNGFLFAPGSAEGCADAIVRAYKARKRMAVASRALAGEYSLPQCTKRLLDIYDYALNKNRGGAK